MIDMQNGCSKPFDVGQGAWMMAKTTGSILGSNQQAKIQERKIKRQKSYNSTWHDKRILGLGTQTWNGEYKYMEDGIKQAEHRSKHTNI